MNKNQQKTLSELADIRVSNVDKKTTAGEAPVFLCNYMDVYSSDYIRASHAFMEATASAAEISRFKVDKGDVLLTKDSETPDDIGIPAVVVDDVEKLVCGYHLALIKPQKNLIDSTYLCKWLGSNWIANYFAERATGSTRYGLSISALSNVKVHLPPLEVQQKISSILVKIDAAIEKTEALIEKYQQIKAGLMHDLFTRGVLPDGKLRPTREQAPELYRETGIGWVPKEWGIAGLASKGRANNNWIRTGPFGSALKGEHWRKHGHPVITIGALGEGEFIKSELLFVSDHDASRLHDFQLRAGDVVFSRVADVGRSVVVKDDNEGWIMSSNLMRIAVDEQVARPDFLQMALSGDTRVKKQIRSRVNSGGRDVANSDILNQLKFVWPSIAEQDKFIAIATRINQRIIGEQKKSAKLQKKKTGLMHDLLTGKVAVKVDAPIEQEA